MKKSKKTIAIATAFAMAIGATGCVPPNDDKPGNLIDKVIDKFDPSDDDVPVVYGPPEDFYDPSDDDVQCEYGVEPDYDPYYDDVEDVYGPPPEEWED